MKNNIKILISIIITAIVCITGTVFATSLMARDIEFSPSESNIEKGFTANNLEDALNEIYDVIGDKNINVITSGKASTTNINSPKNTVNLNVPEDFTDGKALLITVRSSYWWDTTFAKTITGDFEETSEIYADYIGYNSGRDNPQAGNAVAIFLLEGIKPGGVITVSSATANNPQTQAILLSIK